MLRNTRGGFFVLYLFVIYQGDLGDLNCDEEALVWCMAFSVLLMTSDHPALSCRFLGHWGVLSDDVAHSVLFFFLCFFFFNLLKLCDTSWYEIWVYPELVSYCWWNKDEVKTMNVNSLVGSQLKEVSTLSKLKCQENTLYIRTIAYLDLICT